MKLNLPDFLAQYRSPLERGDAISDLAAEIARDPRAPKSSSTRLIDYLLRRNVDTDVLDVVLAAWKAARR